MSHSLGVAIESLVAVLLMLTIGYCMLLNKRLKRLKADEHSLKATIAELITATEIAETIKLPASLDGAWHARGYYGHIRHNVKAIYQKYLGWYDANPVHLDPLPPVEGGRKYVEYMGGAEALLSRAKSDFAKGEFRFVAQAVSHLVFADPDNQAARAMLALMRERWS